MKKSQKKQSKSKKFHMENLAITTGTSLTTNRLGRSLYRNALIAILELIQNAIDACIEKGVLPKVNIRFYAAGEHPLSSGPCIVIEDGGTGLINQKRFSKLSRDEEGHRQGIGFWSCNLLSSEDQPTVYILTAIPKMPYAILYELNPSVLHRETREDGASADGVCPQEIERSEFPNLPKRGSFFQLVIPNWTETFTEEELISKIAIFAPHHDWKITVNGKKVIPYQFEKSVVGKTDKIADLQGDVEYAFGIKPTDKSPGILLVDKNTKRVVMEVDQKFYKYLHPIFQNPDLTGFIIAPGLEKYATSDRSDMVNDFWSKPKLAKKIGEIANAYANKELHDFFETEKKKSSPTNQILNEAISVFDEMAENQKVKAPDSESSTEKEDSTKQKTLRRKNPNNQNVGKKGKKESRPPLSILLEDEIYEFRLNGQETELPIKFASHNIIKVGVNHLLIKPILKGKGKQQLQSMIDLIIQAYCVQKYPGDASKAYKKSCQMKLAVQKQFSKK